MGTAADPDAGGPLTSGYDPVFKETRVLSTMDLVGQSARKETLIKLPGQFANTNAFEALQEANTGNLSQTDFTILFHFRDLERLSLVETTTGTAKIKVGDRLNAIYQCCSGDLVQKIRPPGIFCVKAEPLFGLHNRRNLLSTSWKCRDPGGNG